MTNFHSHLLFPLIYPPTIPSSLFIIPSFPLPSFHLPFFLFFLSIPTSFPSLPLSFFPSLFSFTLFNNFPSSPCHIFPSIPPLILLFSLSSFGVPSYSFSSSSLLFYFSFFLLLYFFSIRVPSFHISFLPSFLPSLLCILIFLNNIILVSWYFFLLPSLPFLPPSFVPYLFSFFY